MSASLIISSVRSFLCEVLDNPLVYGIGDPNNAGLLVRLVPFFLIAIGIWGHFKGLRHGVSIDD